MLWSRKQLESDEYRKLNTVVLALEREVAVMQTRIEVLDTAMKSLRGKVYQSKQTYEPEESKDSYTPLSPFG